MRPGKSRAKLFHTYAKHTCHRIVNFTQRTTLFFPTRNHKKKQFVPKLWFQCRKTYYTLFWINLMSWQLICSDSEFFFNLFQICKHTNDDEKKSTIIMFCYQNRSQKDFMRKWFAFQTVNDNVIYTFCWTWINISNVNPSVVASPQTSPLTLCV